MNKMNKKLLAAVLALLLLGTASSAVIASADISPSISLLRTQTTLTKSSIGGGEITFSVADFEGALGVEDLTYITVTSLPDAKTGALKLGGIDVMVDQVIPRGSMDFLRFIPAEGSESASFKFKGNSSGWENTDVTCIMNFLKTINFSPVAQGASINTIKGVAAVAALSGYDPDGDDITYTILDYPSNGTVVLEGNKVIYTPNEGYKGKDSLAYNITDKYGNVSKTAQVSIRVEANKAGIVYADMQGNQAHADAVRLAAAGIACYENIAGVYYFQPDKLMTKSDFTVMLMMAAGKEAQPASMTAFADDDKITQSHKGYIATAYALGIIEAENREGELYFNPDKTVTRTEAARMIAKLLSLEASFNSLTVFADYETVPAEARASIAAVCEAGIMTSMDSGLLEPNETITRAQMASLLMNVKEYVEAHEEKSFWDRLFG